MTRQEKSIVKLHLAHKVDTEGTRGFNSNVVRAVIANAQRATLRNQVEAQAQNGQPLSQADNIMLRDAYNTAPWTNIPEFDEEGNRTSELGQWTPELMDVLLSGQLDADAIARTRAEREDPTNIEMSRANRSSSGSGDLTGTRDSTELDILSQSTNPKVIERARRKFGGGPEFENRVKLAQQMREATDKQDFRRVKELAKRMDTKPGDVIQMMEKMGGAYGGTKKVADALFLKGISAQKRRDAVYGGSMNPEKIAQEVQDIFADKNIDWQEMQRLGQLYAATNHDTEYGKMVQQSIKAGIDNLGISEEEGSEIYNHNKLLEDMSAATGTPEFDNLKQFRELIEFQRAYSLVNAAMDQGGPGIYTPYQGISSYFDSDLEHTRAGKVKRWWTSWSRPCC